MQTIIGELGHISPLLTPPRQPQKNDGRTLPVIINLDRLDSAELQRIKNVFIKNAPAVSFFPLLIIKLLNVKDLAMYNLKRLFSDVSILSQ